MTTATDRDHAGTTATPLRFEPRFAGPFPGWTNGGIIAGTLAHHLDPAGSSAVEVRISRPVPLATDLIVEAADGTAALLADGELLARATTADADPAARPPVAPEAARHPEPVVEVANHPAPGCFVCGPEHGAGLNLQPGAVDGRDDVVATVWEPPADLADADGALLAPIVWAALDCPSWFGATFGQPALLGTVRGRRFGPVPAGVPVVVTGWGEGRVGRKTAAGAAIHTFDGHLLAAAASTWIHPEVA